MLAPLYNANCGGLKSEPHLSFFGSSWWHQRMLFFLAFHGRFFSFQLYRRRSRGLGAGAMAIPLSFWKTLEFCFGDPQALVRHMRLWEYGIRSLDPVVRFADSGHLCSRLWNIKRHCCFRLIWSVNCLLVWCGTCWCAKRYCSKTFSFPNWPNETTADDELGGNYYGKHRKVVRECKLKYAWSINIAICMSMMKCNDVQPYS